jgi:hypothetical protein
MCAGCDRSSAFRDVVEMQLIKVNGVIYAGQVIYARVSRTHRR